MTRTLPPSRCATWPSTHTPKPSLKPPPATYPNSNPHQVRNLAVSVAQFNTKVLAPRGVALLTHEPLWYTYTRVPTLALSLTLLFNSVPHQVSAGGCAEGAAFARSLLDTVARHCLCPNPDP